VKESGDTFEAATDLAMDTLTRKVKQFKEKTKSIDRVMPEVLLPEEVEEDI
jgi:ribosome-associated translation inhibitor RaiA